MINQQKGTIEKLANFFFEHYYHNSKLNFEENVSRIEFTNDFLLQIINKEGQINSIYLVSPVSNLIADTSQPFHAGIMKHFIDFETFPANNYWIGYIEVDENFMPIRTQRFKFTHVS